MWSGKWPLPTERVRASVGDRTGAGLCPGGTRCGMEVDGRGAGGDHGLVPRSAGNMERGNDNQPGTETITADGDRIRAGGWEQPSGADGSADSLAFWHDNELERKAGCPGECPLKTPAEAVSRIHKMAPRRTYAEIATALNRAGLRSAFGRRFTSQHVGYICRRDGLAGRKPRSRSKPHGAPEAGGPAES